MIFADALSSIGSIGSAVAAVAALVTIFFASRTVAETRAGRREAVDAHAEEMGQQAALLRATQAAHEHEMAERERALQRELWLQRLTQLGALQGLLAQVADAAGEEIPGRVHDGQPASVGIRATRLTSATMRAQAALVILEPLGGPSLPNVRRLTDKGREAGALLHEIQTEATRAIAATQALADNDASFNEPVGNEPP